MEIKIEMSPMTKGSMVNYFGSFLFGIKYPKHVKKKNIEACCQNLSPRRCQN